MTTLKQSSFSGGEISPSLYSRADIAKYQTGLRACRNFAVARHGGVLNRPGSKYIAGVKTHSKTVRLIPFVFNNDQTYVLEFGDLYMRVYRNGAQVLSGMSPYEIATPYVEANLQTLQYAQSGDIVTIVHPSYAPRELRRTGHTSWTLTSIAFGITTPAPTLTSVTGGVTAVSPNHWYGVTAVDEGTGEESVVSNLGGSTKLAEALNPVTVSWTYPGTPSISEFRIYRMQDYAVIGLIGTVNGSGLSFVDYGFDRDLSSWWPFTKTVFGSTGNYPSAVGYYQQRRVFAGPDNNNETIFMSKVGLHKNFLTATPITDDDSVAFTLSGKYVNAVRHIIELKRLIALTSGGEWTVEGDSAGIITPTQINAKQHAYNGSSTISPLIVDGTVLYIQARGSIIRDLGFDFEVDGYKGNDLTIFSSHLFDGYTIRDWAYQQIPHSIVWVARTDGKLLGLTYIREHQMLAWHRHDTDGTVEQVVSVPEGTEDALYLVVNRTINGATKRYVERILTQKPSINVDMTYLDSYLSYDGRHTGSTTMTVSGGTTWGPEETLTLTASASTFSGADVGNAIHMTGADGTIIRFLIDAYTSPAVVTGNVNKIIPLGMRSVALGTWALAVDSVSGLDHLEGKSVSVFADGLVVASPNNPGYSVLTVTSGSINLPRPYGVIHVGLPITADLETLDIETTQSETLVDKNKLITAVTAYVEASHGAWVGVTPKEEDDLLEGLTEMNLRDTEEDDEPTTLETGPLEINIRSEWNSNGRILIRHVDPTPLSVLGIMPSGMIPFRR